MASNPPITPGMQVLTSDRELFGTVERGEGESIKVRPALAGGEVESVPMSWIERVDEHVHLNRAGAEIEVGLRSARFEAEHALGKSTSAASGPAPGRQIWIWGAVAILILLLLILLF